MRLAGPPEPGPVYIGGPDRCGKSTLAGFLASHSRIAVPAVGSNMWTYFYGQYGDLAVPANLQRCLDALLTYKHVRFLRPDPERIRREFAEGEPSYARLFALFLIHFAEAAGKPRWGAQTGLIEQYADHLFSAHPDLRIIHMVRDPRDRYEASLARWPAGRGRAGAATARWRYSMTLGRRHRARYGDAYLMVRFEDLVGDTEATLRTVCAFLGEAFEPSMLDLAGAPKLRDHLATGAFAGSGRLLSDDFIGKFRSNVPPRDIAFIQLHTRRLLREFGYEPERGLLTPAQWAAFAVRTWPVEAARMLAWRGVEEAQQRLPHLVGRTPGARMIVREPLEAAG